MLPIDPLTSLAMSIQANPGVYALLIGSGISRAAAIPTGWEVTIDLIRRVAAAQNEDPGDSPAEWFRKKYNKDADYSDLLDELYDQGTRQAKLREYFEPTEEEREEGKKLPTMAHKGIARLVRGGYIRVIITTNFDHLLEDAIRDEGLEPVIISSPDGINGAIPIVHSKCTIIKVHGDYLDTRIKNTKQELTQYDEATNTLLDRVFDEFGLIVSGWSSEYDPALRVAIERAANQRYSIFWTSRGQPSGAAEKLISVRRARKILVKDADELFDSLAEKVNAISDSMQPHPSDTVAMVAQVKRYLPEEKQRIRLHDLIIDEAVATLKRLNAIESERLFEKHNFQQEVSRREEASEKLLRVFATCGLHGRAEKAPLLRRAIEIIASASDQKQPTREGLLSLYSAMLSIYVISLAAFSAKNESVVAQILQSRGVQANLKGNIIELFAHCNLEPHTQNLPNGGRLRAPVSEFLFQRVKPLVRSLFSDDSEFDLAFDKLEYLIAFRSRASDDGGYIFFGRWMYHAAQSARRDHRDVRTAISDEITALGSNWPYLQYGLFEEPVEAVLGKKAKFDEHLSKAVESMGW